MNNSLQRWSVDKSAELYGVRNWGAGYFDISADGEVIVKSGNSEEGQKLSLVKLASELKNRGLDVPVLVRFSNILSEQISLINRSFQRAMKEYNYQGSYRGVYPIKVNQQQQVVEDIVRFGRPYHYGLEAGSKPELMAAMSLLDDPEACLICNGYKDKEFIDLGLYACKMGLNCILVIEMPSELPLILERAEALGIEPNLGVRIKLSSQAGGHWTESGGDRSVFGLNMAQVVQVVDQLKEAGKIDCLKLLHYHLGSQVPNIRDVRNAVTEAVRVYTGMVEEGATGLEYFDIGGGMAVDYDGSSTNFSSSRNYTIYEYCADVMEILIATLDEKGIPHPTIVSEFGRATVAYSSVLLFNILEVSRFDAIQVPEIPEEVHDHVKHMSEIRGTVNTKNLQECYHDALYYRDEVRQLFKHGNVGLRERAIAESLFWHLMSEIAQKMKGLKYVPDDISGLDKAISDIYYGNFSVFQSLPDSWAIDQLFPVMPVHRLGELPGQNGIISDITCDCDGVIDRFIDLRDVKHSLPMHQLVPGEDYYMGVFLVGAYQETLGDLHNLLGDTHVVSVEVDNNGDYTILQEIEGDSVEEVLQYVEYDTKQLMARLKAKAERAIRQGLISAHDRRQIVGAFLEGLRGYTYFED